MTITINLDIPYLQNSPELLEQAVFDNLLNFAIVHHSLLATKWGRNADMVKFHNMWAEILDKATMTVT